MNVFKGVLFLLDSSPTPIVYDDARHYGAATAANDFGHPLGNRAASERWFGRRASDDGAGAREVELKRCA